MRKLHDDFTNEHIVNNKTSEIIEGLADKRRAAEFLDWSVRTLETKMKEGAIPYLKIGRTVRFDLVDVRAHLNRTCRVGGASR